MTTKKEVEKHVKIALKEIGKIVPWFDEEVDGWVFSHPKYPVEYAGNSANEVLKKYPLYLKQFIRERLNQNLSPLTEIATKGRGGKYEDEILAKRAGKRLREINPKDNVSFDEATRLAGWKECD